MNSNFLEECFAILTRTPRTLDAQLRHLPEAWTSVTEGEGTWSPYDVVGHLIQGEIADWVPRIKLVLEHGPSKPFAAFDREAQFRDSNGKSLSDLLDEFSELRERNLGALQTLNLQPEQFELKGAHPKLGPVTLRELLATWTAHDLAHLLQINRVMAKRYRKDVGPFAQFLSVMK